MGETESYAVVPTLWGLVGLLGDEKGVRRLTLPLPSIELLEQHLIEDDCLAQLDSDFCQPLQQAIAEYFRARPVDFSPYPVSLNGRSDFTRRVLVACRSIRYGQTTTYGQLAALAGVGKATRAVGRALASNPVPLVIPCHRILRADGSLGGFSAPQGTAFKEKLLQLEKEVLSS
ncbi:MAG: methylated-DNA--[protein]-cysteine S-methyltransferase [Sedimentisphaerales bacterium]|nr:methylated-DNA--[protein]-cysteine S-methyltransferase [Sedimentisphaerales bacterium]